MTPSSADPMPDDTIPPAAPTPPAVTASAPLWTAPLPAAPGAAGAPSAGIITVSKLNIALLTLAIMSIGAALYLSPLPTAVESGVKGISEAAGVIGAGLPAPSATPRVMISFCSRLIPSGCFINEDSTVPSMISMAMKGTPPSAPVS